MQSKWQQGYGRGRNWRLPGELGLGRHSPGVLQDCVRTGLLHGPPSGKGLHRQISAAHREVSYRWCAACGYAKRGLEVTSQPNGGGAGCDVKTPLEALNDYLKSVA